MVVAAIVNAFKEEYKKSPVRVKVLDAFLVYALATAGVQFAYMMLVGTFPFNAFLAGFLSCIGFFALTVCLRMQVDPANKDFAGISPERAFADYCLANLVLHLVVWNYMG
ncbi:epsilon subunit of defender against death protein/oligosaccharyltransferase [Volvox carteri f. nagariensis]|uniref:Dolichyl-diphosphooligosaccharide--protein glycosyltransferase subunit DAD1 n=1 Tax=Volvox carteri f. nagariensis TaxID=3068 RepID=D8UD77_VOLCA|nr:epsilon subunit of defender against death protein/oligosaccharyltransferase [Volvox carteri f. nagariensis]EFJ42384.1 epsilon subunit of defender against death protein/oligosaccharyltransferase [Volvox carteri f. nagariensis]|eukprot:XP_002956617.1 epsilon subunit of defender against death protein/oligosaccharyltransferase [Volvox carteri f. nagariensis]